MQTERLPHLSLLSVWCVMVSFLFTSQSQSHHDRQGFFLGFLIGGSTGGHLEHNHFVPLQNPASLKYLKHNAPPLQKTYADFASKDSRYLMMKQGMLDSV